MEQEHLIQETKIQTTKHTYGQNYEQHENDPQAWKKAQMVSG